MESFTHAFNIFISFGLLLYSIFSLTLIFNEKTIVSCIKRNAYPSILIISGVAVLFSLIYSDAIGYTACDLCWYQRIFIYGTFFISLVGYVKKHTFKIVRPYILTFMSIGGTIALYHTIITYTQINPLPCSATASCTMRYVYEFGIVTIPLMSLLTIVCITLIAWKNKENN